MYKKETKEKETNQHQKTLANKKHNKKYETKKNIFLYFLVWLKYFTVLKLLQVILFSYIKLYFSLSN